MEWYWWLSLGALLGAATVGLLVEGLRRWRRRKERGQAPRVRPLLEGHFRPARLDELTVSERQFPYRVRADLHRAIDRLFGAETRVLHFCGVRKEHSYEAVQFAGLLVE